MNVDLYAEGEKTVSLVVINNKLKTKEKIEGCIKRIIDIIGGICGLALIIPIMIGIYIAQKVSKDKGSIFYKQVRIGKDGKKFEIYKFRTMVTGADEKLQKYLEENEDARKEFKLYRKLRDDPRITKLGYFLRKTSIDEIPQFINVLKGDMSLVGPRPYLVREKEDMGLYYNHIIKCKPGITGLWQVNGRSETTFNERVQIDMFYVHRYSLKMDLKILIQTIKKVIVREGAL